MLKFLRRGGKDEEKTKKATEKTRRGLFGQMTSLFRGAKLDEELWEQVEELLISADVGVASTMDLVERLRERVKSERVSDSEEAFALLKEEMIDMIRVEDSDRRLEVDEKPLVLLVVGVNGVGKTTSIAKLVNLYKEDGQKVIVGAADTFRAAATEQIQAWGQRLGVDVIAHQAGADPGAVAFDTIQAAKSRGADVVIIDTAGRLHTKTNLMEELKKIQRIVARQGVEQSMRILLTLDATTGQNGLIQARAFTEAIECHGVILSKLDGTAKGGIVIAITKELGLPVLYIGTGEQPDDIAAFEAESFVNALFEGAEH
jgi:fused signal recognition particle receptor